MKNLKKILIAVLVLAAVVATVVITALAAGDNGSYTGTLDEAKKQFTAAMAKATDAEKSEALTAVGAYIQTVDPDSDGFEAFAVEYNSATYDIAWKLIVASDAVDESGTLDARAAAYKQLYKHITMAAIIADHADDTTLSRWNNVRAIYSEKAYAVAELMLTAVKADKTADSIEALYSYLTEAPVVTDGYDGFADIAAEYNTMALETVNASLASAPATLAGFDAVLLQYEKTPVIAEYADAAVLEAEASFKSDFDTKVVGVGSDMLALITDEASYTQNTNDLKAVYAYIAEAKLFDRTSVGYLDLVSATNDKSLYVAERYYTAAESVVGSPDSTEVPEFRKSVNELLAFLKDAPSIIYRETYSLEFNGSLTEAQALLDAVSASDYTTYAPLYAYMTATPVDPSAEGADAFYAAYDAATKAVSDAVIGKLESATLADIMEISKFLQKTPVSLEAIHTYNGKLHDFTVTLKDNFDSCFSEFTAVKSALDSHLEACPINTDMLGADSDYAAFADKVAVLNGYEAIKTITDLIDNGTDTSLDAQRAVIVKAINDLMVAALLDYDELESREHTVLGTGDLGEAQQMIQDFNDLKTSAEKATKFAELYLYLKEYPINPNLDGYSLFYDDYVTAANEVGDYLISTIKTAADMDAVRDYLTLTPVTAKAIEGYNAKYLIVYRESLQAAVASYEASSKALHELLAAPENAAALSAVDGLSEALDNYEALEIMALTQLYNLIYLDDTNGVISVIPRGNAVRKINAYVAQYPIADTVHGAAEIMLDVAAAADDYKAVIERAKTELDDQAPFEQYNYNAYSYSANWDDGNNPLNMAWSDNSTGFNTGTHWEVVKDEQNGGFYWKNVFGTKNDGGQSPTSAFWGPSGIDSTRGLVMEFDMTASENADVYFRRIEYPTRQSNSFFKVKNNKVYAYIDGKLQSNPLIEEDVITPGAWTHFIMVYFPEEQMVSLYVDYQYLGKWSAIPPDYTVFTELRVQSSATNSYAAYDNFALYQGTAYRIRDKFEKMDEGEKFKYYVDYMCNANNVPSARLTAYQEANARYEQFANDPAYKEYVTKFHSLDIENDIIKPTKANNLAKLKETASAIDSYLNNPALVTSANSADVQVTVKEISDFIAVNGANLDQASREFTELVAKVNAVKSQIERCDIFTSFVKSLRYFDRAFSYSAKMRHYSDAASYYEAGDFRSAAVRESLASDPVLVAFEAEINGSLSPADERYIDVFEFYANCAGVLSERQIYENSGKIIDCLSFITRMDGYEATVEFWQANYDYISSYTDIIRDLVKTNNYDPSYPGVNEAIAEFEEIDLYFYDVLQDKHEAYLGELIGKYPLVNSYIEKLGICSSAALYLAENDVDDTRPALLDIITRYNAYAAELETYKDDYTNVLEENTVRFINLSTRMDAYVDYASLKALYDEASVYYYEMNSDTDAAKAAIEVFEAYGKKLAEIEEASAMLIGYANDVKSARNDGKLYEALVNCSKYIDTASKDVEGAAAAFTAYESALADYNAKYLPCNSEIAEANTVVCAVRSETIAEAILSVIAAIFNK